MFRQLDKSTTDTFTYNSRLIEFALKKLYAGVDRYGERHVTQLMGWLYELNPELTEQAATRENAATTHE